MRSKHSGIIGITMGCPVGIGPEIVVKFISRHPRLPGLRPVVLGDCNVLERCARELKIPVRINSWQPGQDIIEDGINVLALSNFERPLIWGQPDIETGRAMADYIKEAVRLIQAGELAGMVTCPITKSALQAAGYHYPGHTEMLAELCGGSEYAMMMTGDRLKIVLATIHVSLATVPSSLSFNGICNLIKLTGMALRQDFNIARPRIAVAGLNPHAGENGLFGDEEEKLLKPAIAACQDQGWLIAGPLPPDTVFLKAVNGEFDAVVCMYHDQGLIPFKLLHFADGVNVTIGLPIVRTSVDHGTAYDIAGKGLADESSLAAAYQLAGSIIQNRGITSGP